MACPQRPYPYPRSRPNKSYGDVPTKTRDISRRPKLCPSTSTTKTTHCAYCNERMTPRSVSFHVEQHHVLQQFRCCLCQLGFDRFPDIMDHFARHHGRLSGSKLTQLVTQQRLILPQDLRSLRCRLCREVDRWFWAQDRVALKNHLARSHEIHVHVSELPYSCRVCGHEFRETESVLRHPCCALNGQNRYLPQPLIDFEHFDRDRFSQKKSVLDETAAYSFTPETFVQPSERENDPKGSLEMCLYCPDVVSTFQSVSHKSQHEHLDFQCRFCVRSDPFLKEILVHLVRDHGYDETRIMSMSPVSLGQDGFVIFPKDIRSFVDKESRLVLAQSRENLDLSYSCRACGATGFNSSKSLFQNHDCGLVSSGKYVFKINEVPDFGPSLKGDLRCLVCKFCGLFIKADTFRSMVRHLEDVHRKFESSRTDNLEDFVIFSCTQCPSILFKSVLQWDRHFTSDFTACQNGQVNPPSDLESTKSMPAIKLSDEKDLRLLVCTFCDLEIHGKTFSSMADHLRQDHEDQIRGFENNLHLFTKFGCVNCPRGTTVGESVPSWEAHFCSSSFRQCVVSAQREHFQAQELEGTTELPDLRLLQCQVCQFESNGSSFPQIWPHLVQDHGIGESSLGESVRFGCSNCPNFSPPSVQIWERHFSSTYKLCQGSAPISGRSSLIRFWCDTCRETRTDFEAHLKGDTHRRNLSDERIHGDELAVLTCDICPDIRVTTEANLRLHHVLGKSHNKQRFHKTQ